MEDVIARALEVETGPGSEMVFGAARGAEDAGAECGGTLGWGAKRISAKLLAAATPGIGNADVVRQELKR